MMYVNNINWRTALKFLINSCSTDRRFWCGRACVRVKSRSIIEAVS